MRLLFDIAALLAATVLGYLLYLLLFQRGAFSRISGAVHELDDHQRLRLLSALLATPALRQRALSGIRVPDCGGLVADVMACCSKRESRSPSIERE